MKTKIISVFIFFGALWGFLFLRASYLQFFPHEKLSSLQERQFQTVVNIPARRGHIVDREGRDLALTTQMYSLFADPKIIEEKKKTAQKLSKILGISNSTIFNKIKDSQKRFVWIEKLISSQQMEQIKALKIKGLGFVEDWKRVYPNDQLLSSIIGFTGNEGQGLEGLELLYDKELKGENKKVSLKRDARGRPLLNDGTLFTEFPQGKEIKLTIDADLQYFVETELKNAMKNFDSEGAYAVVLDAKTSAIRAMASLPNYDLNEPFKSSATDRRNRSVTDSFEPGSTLKTFIIAQALENKAYQANSKINCENGYFKIGKRVIREAEQSHSQGLITLNEVLAYSSNIGTSKVALKLGESEIRRALLNFGFGQKSGVDLPGESKGIVVPLPWSDHLLANVSFGHGITTTPLQMANAYAVIANGGYLNKPYIVESISSPGQTFGGEVQNKSQILRRVISEETAKQMRLMLASVTSGKGTGLNARVDGYIVGGKTGTAQKIKTQGRGYMPGAYIASFAGFIPANDPQYVIYVAVDYPKKVYYGSQVAAPLFSSIASYAVRRDGVTPEVIAEQQVTKAPQMVSHSKNNQKVLNKAEDLKQNHEVLTAAPDLLNLSTREAFEKASHQKIKLKIIGQGQVYQTSPEPGSALGQDRSMTLYLKE